jgi:hypothetical protein
MSVSKRVVSTGTGSEGNEGCRGKNVAADVLIEEDILGKRCKLITVILRAANQIEQVHDVKTLPLLLATHSMAGL